MSKISEVLTGYSPTEPNRERLIIKATKTFNRGMEIAFAGTATGLLIDRPSLVKTALAVGITIADASARRVNELDAGDPVSLSVSRSVSADLIVNTPEISLRTGLTPRRGISTVFKRST